jgi:hypothetical protein
MEDSSRALEQSQVESPANSAENTSAALLINSCPPGVRDSTLRANGIVPAYGTDGDVLRAELSDAEKYLRHYMARRDWTEGVTKHDQTFRSFLTAARAGVSPERAVQLVVAQIQSVGAVIVERDILRQRARAYQFVTDEKLNAGALPPGVFATLDGNLHVTAKLPPFSRAKLKALVEQLEDVVDANYLRSKSPVLPATWCSYLAAIYRPGDRILVFTKMDSRSSWMTCTVNVNVLQVPSGGDGVWYLCNPVDGEFRQVARCISAHNPEGWTCRAEECVTDFRFMVLESDHGDNDYPGVAQDWLKFLALLPLRIVAIYTSAGKSVHALVQIDATDKADWDRQVRVMKPFLVEHGADKGALSAVRLTRLPHAFRRGRKQELYFCNPDADGKPICQMPAIRDVPSS